MSHQVFLVVIIGAGLCLPCDLRDKDLYNYDPNAYSFDNSNHFPQLQDENYLCNLCGNNSHDGYDCQQQFPFVYEHEPSYNQNYDDNYYPHESPSFPCCDYCGGSHKTFQCQPDNQNVDFSGSDQIQTPQYPDDNPPSPEIKPPQDSDIHQLIEECSEEVPGQQKQNMEKKMLDLVKICHHKQFLCIHDDVDDLIESALESKLLSINSINSINSQRLDKKEQEFLCIHDDVDDLIESALESKLLSINSINSINHIEKSLQNFRVIHKSSISLNTSQISSIHSVAPILSTKEPENSLSMGYEHLSITPETESDEVTKSNAENLLPIPSEYEILFDSNNDDLSSDDESFEDIEYVDASVPDPAIVSVEEENVVQQEEEEVDLEDISQIQDVVRERNF
nr:hypothetical protein [Tanacetum cinerariifolium]